MLQQLSSKYADGVCNTAQQNSDKNRTTKNLPCKLEEDFHWRGGGGFSLEGGGGLSLEGEGTFTGGGRGTFTGGGGGLSLEGEEDFHWRGEGDFHWRKRGLSLEGGGGLSLEGGGGDLCVSMSPAYLCSGKVQSYSKRRTPRLHQCLLCECRLATPT